MLVILLCVDFVVTSTTAGDLLLILLLLPPSPHAVILYLAPGTSEWNVTESLWLLFTYCPTTGCPKSSL